MPFEQFSLELKSALENAENVLICLQQINDTDTMASGLALTKLISAHCPHIQSVRLLQVRVEKSKVGDLKKFAYWPLHDPAPNEKTLFITVDINVNKHIDEDIRKMAQKCGKVMRIDHHDDLEELTIGEEKIASIDLSIPSYSSCCEVIWDLAEKMNWKKTQNIAEIIFRGIFVDSRQFTSIKTNENTFRIVSEIYKTGAQCRNYMRSLSTFSFKELCIIADLIKNAQLERNLAILNLNPEIIYQHYPKNFDKTRDGKIKQKKILTFPLNALENLLDVKTIFYIHYCLIAPFHSHRKFVIAVLNEPNPDIEKILLDNGFSKQRNRFSRSIYFSDLVKLLSEHRDIFSK